MQTVELADTGRRTTRLGFGCSSIMGGMGRKDSLQTLEWAFDAGVRHFDVAPMYGYGEAEDCLGEFVARHAGEITVATKFGIPPMKNTGMASALRALARPILKAVPALKARAQRAATAVANEPATRSLSVPEAEASLHNSLRLLRLQRIDVFLLHDARLDELQDEALLRFLEDSRKAGKIGSFGVGTDRADAADILREQPRYAPVVQREWSVFNPHDTDTAFHIHHRSLSSSRSRLLQYLQDNPALAAAWSDEVGSALLEPGVLSSLMMRAALLANPGGVVLFSSKDRRHMEENASLAEPSAHDAKAEALYRLVQREFPQGPPGGAA